MSCVELSRTAEFEIDAETRRALLGLLRGSFPEFFASRIYFKQLPHFRCIARVDGEVVAQVGIDHRVIRVGDTNLTIFGVIDLCVAVAHRGRGLGARLLSYVEALGRDHGIESIVLLADDHRLYRRLGYELITRRCIWFGIDEHRSLNRLNQELEGCLMVKSLAGTPWPTGDIDFLGYLF